MGGGNGYPLDSRYSWFVAAVCCLLYTAAPSMSRIIGIILVEIKPRYGIDDETGMWIVSLCPTVGLLAGPVSGYLLTRLEHRLVAILGLFLISAGFIILAYAPTYHLLYIATICIGVGTNFNFMTCVVTASFYFLEKRATAIGFVTTGAGIGTLYMPPICRFLFDNVTVQETFMLIAAFVLQLVVLAMFIKPEPYWKYDKFKDQRKVLSSALISEAEEDCKLLTQLRRGSYDERMQLSPLTSDTCDATKSMNNLSPTSAEKGNPLKKNTSTSMADIILASSEMDLHMINPSDETLPEVEGYNDHLPLKQILHTLFTSKMFLCYLLSSVLTVQAYQTIFTVLPLYAEELNIPKYHVSTALAVYGAVEIPSRLAHGVFANQKYISALCQLGLSAVSAALSVLLLVLWPIKEMMYVCCLLLGFSCATIVGLTPIVMLERFDKRLISVAMGLVYGLQGLSSPISFGITPVLFQVSGSWNLSLKYFIATFASGGFLKIICSLVFPVDVRFNCRRIQRRDDVSDSSSER